MLRLSKGSVWQLCSSESPFLLPNGHKLYTDEELPGKRSTGPRNASQMPRREEWMRETAAGIGRRVEALRLFWAGTEVELAVLSKIASERQTGSALNSWLKSQLVITGQFTH
jgi:hypothetical protein